MNRLRKYVCAVLAVALIGGMLAPALAAQRRGHD